MKSLASQPERVDMKAKIVDKCSSIVACRFPPKLVVYWRITQALHRRHRSINSGKVCNGTCFRCAGCVMVHYTDSMNLLWNVWETGALGICVINYYTAAQPATVSGKHVIISHFNERDPNIRLSILSYPPTNISVSVLRSPSLVVPPYSFRASAVWIQIIVLCYLANMR